MKEKAASFIDKVKNLFRNDNNHSFPQFLFILKDYYNQMNNIDDVKREV